MPLEVHAVDAGNVLRFVHYCAQHGPEHDSSWLPGRDFAPTPEQPSYLLESGRAVVGAVSLMRSAHYLKGRKARFSIFHATSNSFAAYARLFAAIQPHFEDLDSVYLFVPEEKQKVAAIFGRLGFAVERYSYILRCLEPGIPEVLLPDEFSVEPLQPTDSRSHEQFAGSLNDSFSGLQGHFDIGAGDVRGWFDDDVYLDGGLCLLTAGGRAVGTVCITMDVEDRNTAEIAGLGIAREYRGKGLGRLLLRHAISFARQSGLQSIVLCVNAENDSALRLYLSEGFTLTETVVCYALDCA